MISLSDGGKEGAFHAQLVAGIREMRYIFPSSPFSLPWEPSHLLLHHRPLPPILVPRHSINWREHLVHVWTGNLDTSVKSTHYTKLTPSVNFSNACYGPCSVETMTRKQWSIRLVTCKQTFAYCQFQVNTVDVNNDLWNSLTWIRWRWCKPFCQGHGRSDFKTFQMCLITL